jgi:hypothetical protein
MPNKELYVRGPRTLPNGTRALLGCGPPSLHRMLFDHTIWSDHLCLTILCDFLLTWHSHALLCTIFTTLQSHHTMRNVYATHWWRDRLYGTVYIPLSKRETPGPTSYTWHLQPNRLSARAPAMAGPLLDASKTATWTANGNPFQERTLAHTMVRWRRMWRRESACK